MVRKLSFAFLILWIAQQASFANMPPPNPVRSPSGTRAAPKCDPEAFSPPPAALQAVGRPAIPIPKHFPPFLKILANADAVVLGPVGVAAACNEECKAYLEAGRQPSTVRKEIEWMVKNATPAGKLYAALLLRRIDKAAGIQALESLKAEKEPVYFGLGGCIGGERKPLGEHADFILKNPRMID